VKDGRNTFISCLEVTFFLQVGHLPCILITVLMQFLQKICPHLVDISSTKGSIHIGQLGSAGGSGASILGSEASFLVSADFWAFSTCKRNI